MAEKVANTLPNSSESKENIPQSNGDKSVEISDGDGVKIGESYLVKRLGSAMRECCLPNSEA